MGRVPDGADPRPALDATVTESDERVTELALLLEDYARVKAGTTRSVVLEGPSGSGKTGLIRAFTERVQAEGAAVLRRTCLATELDRPYGAVAGLDPALIPGAVAGSQLSLRLSGMVGGLLASGPVVIVLDEAEWCDEPSLRWLGLLQRRSHSLPLLIVLSQRPALLPPWRRLLDGSDLAGEQRHMLLGAFSGNDVKAWLERWWPAYADPAFARDSYGLSLGLPSLLSALMQALQDGGHGPGPQAREAAVAIGVGRLAAHAEIVLRHHAAHVCAVAKAFVVLGRTDPEPIALLAGVPQTLVPATLDLLRDEGLVPADDDSGWEHARAAVLACMDSETQVAWYWRAARVLNDLGGSVEEISTHLARLPDLPDSWMTAALREAADLAERRGDLANAAALRARLIGSSTSADASTDASTDAGAAVDDLIAYTRVLVHLDAPSAHRILDRALGEQPRVRARAALAVQYGRSAVVLGRVPEAVERLTTVLDELTAEIGAAPEPADLCLRAATEAARLALGWNQVSTLASTAARAQTLGTPAGHGRTEREMLAVQAITGALTGRAPAEVHAAARRAAVGEEAPDSWVFAAAAYVLSLMDEPGEAVQALDRVIDHSRAHGLVWNQVAALPLRSWIRQTTGDLTGAVDDARLALMLSESHSWGRPVSTPRVALAGALHRQGDHLAAAEMLEAVDPAAGRDSVLLRPHVLMTRSAVCLALDDPEGALAHALECGRFLAGAGVTNPLFLPWWLEAAPLLAGFGRLDEARQVIAHGTALADHWGSATGHGLALLARSSVETGRIRVATLQAAARVLTPTSSTWYQVRAGIALGDALGAVGESTPARDEYRAAGDLALSNEFRDLAETARELSTAAGARSVTRTGRKLTPSEQRVAQRAATGATNREIAADLVVALRTVEIHLTSVYRKLGIRGRAELASELAEQARFGV